MSISPIGLDFESMPIHEHPAHRLPEPVSFSLQMPGDKEPRFYAWGHKTGGNNCSRDDAEEILRAAYSEVSPQTPLCAFNSAFDLGVANKHFGLAMPPWHSFEDPMFLLFLDDPHQVSLGLKPSAERILGMAPEERDLVVEWILAHREQLEAEFPDIPSFYCRKVKDGVSVPGCITTGNASSLIAFAPGDLVAPYANGDVTRMTGLWKVLRQRIEDRDMLGAYNRERQLMPILSRNAAEGLRVDRDKLLNDAEIYAAALQKTDDWLRSALNAPTLDFNKDTQIAKALKDSGQVTEWTKTSTGLDSVSKKHMKLSSFKDRDVAAAYAYRQKCATILETFIRPWGYYSAFDGWMRTSWNQVRNASRGGGAGGARTGRPSSQDPNFFNMPKPVEDNAARGFIMPTHIEGLPELPFVRAYILPDEKDHVIVRRDFSSQELRVLAHFEDGALLASYLSDPGLDVHEYVRKAILSVAGVDVGRVGAKGLMFGYVYGMGLSAAAAELNKPLHEVKQIRAAQMRAVPGLKDLDAAIKERAAMGQPIRTWGGREYYAEPPRWSEKFQKMMDFVYKLLNVLIQGSAADITKQSIINYDERRAEGRFMLSVYDEDVISVPKAAMRKESLILRGAMLDIDLDVPLLSDGEWGRNYGELEDLVEEKPDLSRWGITNW